MRGNWVTYTVQKNIMNAPPPIATKIIELRAQLKAQFPEAHAESRFRQMEEPSTAPQFGLPCLDQHAIPPGSVVEIVGPRWSCGSGLLLVGLLEATLRQGRYAALIDGRDAFDPQSLPGDLLQRLLWVRCKKVEQVTRCADLLLRDGNLPLVIADMQLNATRDLQRVPGSTWFRLRALAESRGACFFAFTPCQTVAGVRLRLLVDQGLGLDALDEPRMGLVQSLQVRAMIERRRGLDVTAEAMLAKAG